jgi:hypothetical protein
LARNALAVHPDSRRPCRFGGGGAHQLLGGGGDAHGRPGAPALGGEVQHPLLASSQTKNTGKTLTLVLTSDRGLCGPYNGSVLRETMKLLRSVPGTKDGYIERTEMESGSNRPELDSALKRALTGGIRVSREPPEDLPQPIRLRISSRG